MDRFLHNDTVLRILALVLACAIWLGVNAPGGAQATSGGLSQPFSYLIKVRAPEGMVATTVVPSFADVIVTGDPTNLATMQSEMAHVTVVADASALSAGTHTVRLQVEGMPMIAHTLDPQTVTVVLKAMQTLRAPLHVQVVGPTQSGYVYGTPHFEGQTAMVSGATATTQRVASVRAVVSIAGKLATFTQNVPLVAVDIHGKRVQGVTVTPESLAVTVPVESPKTNAPVVAQIVGTPAPGYAVADVTMNPSTVMVYGVLPQASDGTSTTPTITVPVNVTGMRGTTTVRVTIPLESGVTQVVPDNVQATVTVLPSESRTLNQVPIRIINVPHGESVRIVGPHTVSITLSGPKPKIDTLTISDLSAYIDASHVTKDQSATLTIQVPPWIHVTQLSRGSVALRVSAS